MAAERGALNANQPLPQDRHSVDPPYRRGIYSPLEPIQRTNKELIRVESRGRLHVRKAGMAVASERDKMRYSHHDLRPLMFGIAASSCATDFVPATEPPGTEDPDAIDLLSAATAGNRTAVAANKIKLILGRSGKAARRI